MKLVLRQLRHVAKEFIGRRGYEKLTDRPPLNLDSCSRDILEQFAISGGHPFLATVPLEHCRILRGVRIPCVVGSYNPFVEGLTRYANSGEIKDVERVLSDFYATFRPSTAGELLGIGSSGRASAVVSPYGILEPWEGVSSPRQARAAKRWALSEQRQHGVNGSNVLGWRHFGPMHPQGVRLEARRLKAAFDSIADVGYQRHDGIDGDIRVQVLEDENGDLRYCVIRGHHRAAAVAALGHKEVLVRIGAYRIPWVKNVNVKEWPAVTRQVISEGVALAIFNRIHSGGPTPALADWIENSGRQ